MKAYEDLTKMIDKPISGVGCCHCDKEAVMLVSGKPLCQKRIDELNELITFQELHDEHSRNLRAEEQDRLYEQEYEGVRCRTR